MQEWDVRVAPAKDPAWDFKVDFGESDPGKQRSRITIIVDRIMYKRFEFGSASWQALA